MMSGECFKTSFHKTYICDLVSQYYTMNNCEHRSHIN